MQPPAPPRAMLRSTALVLGTLLVVSLASFASATVRADEYDVSQRHGCPVCNAVLGGKKIATVHPGEPAVTLLSVSSAEACAAACRAASPDVLFYQFLLPGAEDADAVCTCLATCYGVTDAAEAEEAVSGSLCRDLPCPKKCSNAPTSNVMYLGTPAKVLSSPPVAEGFGNATFGSNFTFFANGTANGTASSGMTYETCRDLAASSADPIAPFFTHMEAMGSCLLYTKCVGVTPAGTSTVKSGSFCVPTLLTEDDGDESTDDNDVESV